MGSGHGAHPSSSALRRHRSGVTYPCSRPTTAAPAGEATPTPTGEPTLTLTGLARRRHLKHLLSVRDQLAVLATERYNHNLDDAADTFSLMIDIEDEVGSLFPEVFAALFPRWISTSSRISHEPGDYNPRCGICRAGNHQPELPTAA